MADHVGTQLGGVQERLSADHVRHIRDVVRVTNQQVDDGVEGRTLIVEVSKVRLGLDVRNQRLFELLGIV
ncbi:hypothetical protein D3C80_1168090 [compost metagenome]